MDFDKHRPELICFEDGGQGILPSGPATAILQAHGYRHLFSAGPSHGFVIAERGLGAT
jgi:hypothetical protein